MKNFQTFLNHLSIMVLLHSTGMADASGCKTMKLLQEKTGRYLRNHVIQTVTVSSQSMCRVMCYLSDSCLSVNFHQSTGTCEINDSDEFQHPDDLIPMYGYVYIGTENDCKDNTCPSNSTCQAMFTNEGGYNCICPKGYTGANCEADLDECTTGFHTCPIYGKCVNTMASFYCIPAGTRENPAKSCRQISIGGHSNGSGEYWLDPANTGTPIKVLCDMTTDGGGWTVVTRLIQPSNIALPRFQPSTYEVMKEYKRTDVNVIPMGTAMLDIKNKMGFHQIHFYCRKVNVGRVVSIMTKNNTAGQRVVSFFTNPGSASPRPAACGSFDRLPEDTSILSQYCDQWGASDAAEDKWGASCCVGGMRLAAFAFRIRETNGFEFSVLHSCDNASPNEFSKRIAPDAGDTWQISVR